MESRAEGKVELSMQRDTARGALRRFEQTSCRHMRHTLFASMYAVIDVQAAGGLAQK